MLAVICDKTGVTEYISGDKIEAREGKKPGEWVWVIKGIEKLDNFDPRPYVPELDATLSKQALIDWKEEDATLIAEASAARRAALEDIKAETESMKTSIKQLDVMGTTNTLPK